MSNITIVMDDRILERAQRVAEHRSTTLHALVRDYLAQMAESAEADGCLGSHTLQTSFRQFSGPLDGVDWQRDELYG